MKKAIMTSFVTASAVVGALAQGTVSFENALSSGNITIGSAAGPYAVAGTYTVALLWAAGTSVVPQNALTQIGTYGPAGTQTGFFQDPATITTGTATAPGTPAIFEVQGWTGNYANYAAAVAAGAYVGQTAEFVNGTGDPIDTHLNGPRNTTGWDGNLILVPVPEPGTLALGALGAAALLLFRRRK